MLHTVVCELSYIIRRSCDVMIVYTPRYESIYYDQWSNVAPILISEDSPSTGGSKGGGVLAGPLQLTSVSFEHDAIRILKSQRHLCRENCIGSCLGMMNE